MSEHKKRTWIGLFVLRLGIGLVFFIFGIDKIFSPGHWSVFLPFFITELSSHSHVPVQNLLKLQGMFEMVLGLQLLAGVFTRLTAGGAVFLLGLIIFTIGFDPIGIRDLGLFFASGAILFLGAGEFSVDAWLEKMDSKNTASKNEKK